MIASFVPLVTITLLTNNSADSPFLANMGMAAAVAFLPLLVIAGTSFIKISLVLAILRSALGAPGVPPTSVLAALAAVLSLFVMAPVGLEMLHGLEASNLPGDAASDPFGFAATRALYEAASPPLIDFLKINTPPSEIAFFGGLTSDGESITPGLRILLPAFASGEVVEAFFIGFLVFIPFLVVDLIVANTLLALGMHMVSPMGISLPIKLLLFTVVDGWHILVSGLLVTYSF
jgi:type III secretion protein R